MKYIVTFLIGFMLGLYLPTVHAGSVTVMWEFPTHREDGKLIEAGELTQTKVYFHDTVKNHWTQEVVMYPESSVTLDKPAGTYEVFATVFNTEGDESKPSNKLQWTITDEPVVIDLVRPNPPTVIIVEQ